MMLIMRIQSLIWHKQISKLSGAGMMYFFVGQPKEFYDHFMNFLVCQSGSCVAVNGGTEISQILPKRSSFVFQR